MTTVIYHSADFDGIFCREIAKHFLGEKDVQYIGWNFGDVPIKLPINGEFYILDLPIDKPFGLEIKDGCFMREGELFQPLDRVDWGKFTWIDHHKSSIESHPTDIPGYRIDGVAACRLAWQWFSLQSCLSELPKRQRFIDRQVSEPLAVRLAGEYDVWTRGPDGNLLPDLWEFQCGLRAYEGTKTLHLEWLLDSTTQRDVYVEQIIKDGKIASAYGAFLSAEMMAEAGFILNWEGLRFLAVNNEGRGSQRFASRDTPETGHDALLSFGYNGRGWVVSLYHAKHRTDLDLSQIAVKHGGGGHRGACGFTCKQLPFDLK